MNINISVAMATFNGEKYIQEQLDSIRQQTLCPYELVVCDDGSTDGTIDMIKEFSRTVPFSVRLYLNNNNLGFADNFLKCAALCKGDWIAFSDQDDIGRDAAAAGESPQIAETNPSGDSPRELPLALAAGAMSLAALGFIAFRGHRL